MRHAMAPVARRVPRHPMLWLGGGLLLAMAALCALQLRPVPQLPSAIAAEAQQHARKAQQNFCDERHPLSLPGASLLTLDVRLNKDNAVPLRMHVYDSNDIVSNGIKEGGWEPHVLAQILLAMKRSNSPSPLFVDVGAQVGYHTMMVAAHSYRVLAIEGLWDNVNMLRSTLCENPLLSEHVTLLPTGVSKEPGTCAVMVPDDNVGDGMVVCAAEVDDTDAAYEVASQTRQQRRRQRRPRSHKYHRRRNGNDGAAGNAAAMAEGRQLAANHTLRGEMELQRLDALVAEDVQVLKMDVEGYEPLVLAGAGGLFADHRVAYLIWEFSPKLLRSLQLEPLDVLHQVGLLGFSCSRRGISGPWLRGPALTKLAAHSELDAKGQTWAINLFCRHQTAVSHPAVEMGRHPDLGD